MKQKHWPISLPLVLMLAVPLASAASRDENPVLRGDTPSQVSPLRVAPVRIAPLHVSPLRVERLQVKPLRVGGPEVSPPRGTPPGGTPPPEAPPGETPSEGTPPGEVPPLHDSSRDYRGQLPVFPGAQGFGSTTRAGRGGRILRVTSLADSGPGTLREAVNTPGPRTVIFEVGGVIRLKDQIEVFEPYLTIAGQTAPSPGITLAGDALRFNTHDVLVQHLRIRPGGGRTGTNTPREYRDGLGVRTNSEGTSQTYNIYIDHCSMSWATDENVSLWYRNVYDVTIQNSIIAEAIPFNTDAVYSKGMLVGHGQRRIASLRNLFAHNGGRNPRFSGDSSGLVVNNVIYNIGNAAVMMGDTRHGPILLTVVGNVYLPGQDSRTQRRLVRADNGHRDTRLFVDDNIGPYSSDDSWSVVDNRVGRHIRADVAPVTVAPLTIVDAATSLERVLASAGARPADRDAVDRRMVSDVRSGQGRLLRSAAEVRGLSARGPTRRKLVAPADPKLDVDGDGYTDVEEWLHCMARKVEGRAALTDICPGAQDRVAFSFG